MQIDKLFPVLVVKDVALGEAFIYQDVLYMKIETTEVKMSCWDVAAVRLSDGHVNLFHGSTTVNSVDAKVSYKEKRG